MFTLIAIIAFILWLNKVIGPTGAGLVMLGMVVLFVALGASLDHDGWKAERKWIRYWKDQ